MTINQSVGQVPQVENLENTKQKGILSKFGIRITTDKPPQTTISETKPKKKLFSFLRKKENKKEFGWDRKEVYLKELDKAEALLDHCEKELLFEPKDWKENDIRWKCQLESLTKAAKEIAKIKIYKLSKQLEEEKNKNKK